VAVSPAESLFIATTMFERVNLLPFEDEELILRYSET
jgi:hypothetical protein